MLGLGKLFRKNATQDNFSAIKDRISHNQEIVFEAVVALGGPCNGRMVAGHLHWDSASVTNRLAELTRKGRLQIAYRKKGLDGVWRNYYKVASKKAASK